MPMAYRRDREKALRWSRWVRRNRRRLGECGIPPVVYERERNWWYFLDHEHFAPDPFNCVLSMDDLSEAQASALWRFLEEEEGDDETPSMALGDLRHRFTGRRTRVRED